MTDLGQMYWYLEIEKAISSQWRDLNANPINRIAFCTSRLDPLPDFTIGPTTYSNPLYWLSANEGTAYFNIDLQISSLLESLPDDLNSGALANISSLEFSISKYFSNNTYSIKDFIQTLAERNAFLGDRYSLEGSRVRLWLCNGKFPGAVQVDATTWRSVADRSTVTGGAYAFPYDYADSSQIIFDGILSEPMIDSQRSSFSAESFDARRDKLIGRKILASENSSSEIEPLCFGNADPTGNTFADPAAMFPLALEQSSKSSLYFIASPHELQAYTQSRLVVVDDETLAPGIVEGANFYNATIPYGRVFATLASNEGQTLENFRPASQEDWRLTANEREDLGLDPLGIDADMWLKNQIIANQDGEQIALHTPDLHGFAENPVEASGALQFMESARLESRGFGDTTPTNHTNGTNYNLGDSTTQKNIEAVYHVDLAEIRDISTLLEKSNNNSDKDNVPASSGNVWDMIRNTKYQEGDSTSHGLKFGNVGYGATLDGIPTGLATQPVTSRWQLAIRPQRLALNSDDFIKKIDVQLGFEVDAGKLAGAPPFGSYAKIEFSVRPINNPVFTNWSAVIPYNYFIVEHTSLVCRLRYRYNDASEVIETLSLPNFTNQINDKLFECMSAFVFSLSEGGMDELYEEHHLRLTVEVKSDYEDATTVKFWNSFVRIFALKFQVHASQGIKGRKFYRAGRGIIKPWVTGMVDSAGEACKAITMLYAGQSNANVSILQAMNKKVCGGLRKQIKMRDLMRELLFGIQGGWATKPDGSESEFSLMWADDYREIALSDLLLDDTGTLNIAYAKSSYDDLYSRIVLKFRQHLHNDQFQAQLIIDGDGQSDFTGLYSAVPCEDYLYLLTIDNMTTLKARLKNIRTLLGLSDSLGNLLAGVSDRELVVELPWIRDRATAERTLAILTYWKTTRRNLISFEGRLDTWKDIYVGEQITLDLGTFGDARTNDKRFIVKKKTLTPTGAGFGYQISIEELPNIPMAQDGT